MQDITDPDRRDDGQRRGDEREHERRLRQVETGVELLLAREREFVRAEDDREKRLRRVEESYATRKDLEAATTRLENALMPLTEFAAEIRGSLTLIKTLMAFFGFSGIAAIIAVIIKV